MNDLRSKSNTLSPDWDARMALVVETMREMSSQSDPQAMVSAYASRMRGFMKIERTVSLSRRSLKHPQVRITRDSDWKTPINPWKETGKLPVIQGGLLTEWLYGNEPLFYTDLVPPSGDPGLPYIGGYRSVLAVPHYHQGESLNMVLHMQRAPNAFDLERFPDMVQMSNLFGRATHNLVLSSDLKAAYEALDRELSVVADIQRSLLPSRLPNIPGLDLAAHYQTSRRAGGDYYDLFPLPQDKWGILIADVSGHGTPAAVVMAIMHSIAHSYPGPADPPSEMMKYLNTKLTERYMGNSGTFVTAFYGIYDPATRKLTYSSAGHNPPRIVRACDLVAVCGVACAADAVASSGRSGAVGLAGGSRCLAQQVHGLDEARSLPLGIQSSEKYLEATETLEPGDAVLFYTDGVTEAWNETGDMYGVDRLDEAIATVSSGSLDAAMGLGDAPPAQLMLRVVLNELNRFTGEHPADDDRTILAAVAV